MKNLSLQFISCIGIGVFFTIAMPSCKHAVVANQFKKYLDSANMNLSVSPGDDFFNYANGSWLKKHAIPASEAWWGDAKISENNNFKNIRALLEEAAASPHDPMQKMVGDMYVSGMNTQAINGLGITPIKSDMARIDAISNTDGLLREIALDQTLNLPNSFTLAIYPDLHNSTRLIADFSQGGLGMPEKSYYLNNDPDSKRIRGAYQAYIATTLSYAGAGKQSAGLAAKAILDLETRLAKASKTPEELRDIDGNYHKYSAGQLTGMSPGIKWPTLLAALQISQDSIIVDQPRFFIELGRQLTQTGLDTWKNYLKFNFISHTAIFLDSKIASVHYEFNDKTLNGMEMPPERWDNVSRVIDNLMGDPLGHTYVKKYFPPAAKARMDTLLKNLESAFEERIKNLDWMGEITKQKAIVKLHAIAAKVAYPDKWRTYKGVTISRGTYLKNALACKKYLYQDMITYLKAGKVDRYRWEMTPPTVDAEYDPSLNTIEFPAGVLQYPFFALDADDAVNYGGIGFVIGHELTHGFDDQGRQFDGEGNRKNWWAAADERRFKQKATAMVKLYDGYKVLDSLHVSGELTQGENIADFGGLAISFEAFKKTAEYKAGKRINGFTPAQRYFLSFAQCRRRKMTDNYLKNFVKTDPHAPSWFRINGPCSNFPDFYTTYQVKPGDKMYRPLVDRIIIW